MELYIQGITSIGLELVTQKFSITLTLTVVRPSNVNAVKFG